MRNRALVLIGDSLSANWRTSLGCLLAQERREGVAFFPDYNFTLMGHRSNHLVSGGKAGANSINLNTVDHSWSTSFKPEQKVTDVVFLVGAHFSSLSRFAQSGGKTVPRTPLNQAIGHVARTVSGFLDSAGFKGNAFWMSHSPSSFEGGAWNKGGRCDKFKTPWEVVPYEPDPDTRPFNDALESALVGSNIKLIRATHLTSLRPDGHPAASRQFHGGHIRVQDCVHWCLPGVPDTWSELLMHELGCNPPEMYRRDRQTHPFT